MRTVTSPAGTLLVRQRWRSQELDLVLELDAVLLAGASAGFCHQRNRVGGAGSVGVLDEVRVARRDLGAADPVPLQPARLEHPSYAELVVGVLEHTAEGPLVR